MESKKLIVFGDYYSQPSRAVFCFCLMNKIPHELKLISVAALE